MRQKRDSKLSHQSDVIRLSCSNSKTDTKLSETIQPLKPLKSGLSRKVLRFSAVSAELKSYISQKELGHLSWSEILLIWLKDGTGIDQVFSDDEILDLMQIRSQESAHNRLLFLINQTIRPC